MEHHSLRETAAFGLSLLDLTELDETAAPERIDALCRRAQTPFGNVAAICILPRFVPRARMTLGNSHAIRIAAVVNFPDGGFELADVVSEARQAVADGADEIELVIPHRTVAEGDGEAVKDMVAAVREACPPGVPVKAILETGTLKDTLLIGKAASLAITAGAELVSTSAGHMADGATLEAADILLRAIRANGGKVGFKAAGGIDTVAVAILYLRLAETILASDWAMPSTFRFGADGLLDDIVAILGSPPPALRSTG